jgi:regulator of sigma E protease
MIDIIIKVSQLLLSLSILVVLHELGHFIPAKLFKTKVEKFYLFFDWPFSLFKKKVGDTEYGIGVLPLGGYVKISGMIDESMDTEQMSKPPQPWEFRSKPSWQRLIIMLGGVTVNFILALVIYIGLAYSYGDAFITNESVKGGYLITNPILTEAGFKTGDKIISTNNEEFATYSDLRNSIITAKKYEIERDGEIIDINMPVDFLGQLSTSKDRSLFEFRRPLIIKEVTEESLNKNFNLLQGDVIESINGIEIPYQDQITEILENNKNQTIEVSILRDEMSISKTLNVNQDGALGIIFGSTNKDLIDYNYIELVTNTYDIEESFSVGSKRFTSQVGSYLDQFKAIFSPETGAYKGLGGFIAIGNIFPSSWSWSGFWSITAFLSIMLGVLNLLPIPALDGGHVMFLLYEMITGNKPSDKFMEYAQTAGFLILITLVLFANGNDIFKAIFN